MTHGVTIKSLRVGPQGRISATSLAQDGGGVSRAIGRAASAAGRTRHRHAEGRQTFGQENLTTAIEQVSETSLAITRISTIRGC